MTIDRYKTVIKEGQSLLDKDKISRTGILCFFVIISVVVGWTCFLYQSSKRTNIKLSDTVVQNQGDIEQNHQENYQIAWLLFLQKCFSRMVPFHLVWATGNEPNLLTFLLMLHQQLIFR